MLTFEYLFFLEHKVQAHNSGKLVVTVVKQVGSTTSFRPDISQIDSGMMLTGVVHVVFALVVAVALWLKAKNDLKRGRISLILVVDGP
jgi:hypothetical protein